MHIIAQCQASLGLAFATLLYGVVLPIWKVIFTKSLNYLLICHIFFNIFNKSKSNVFNTIQQKLISKQKKSKKKKICEILIKSKLPCHYNSAKCNGKRKVTSYYVYFFNNQEKLFFLIKPLQTAPTRFHNYCFTIYSLKFCVYF